MGQLKKYAKWNKSGSPEVLEGRRGKQENEDEEVAETWVVGGAVQKQSRAGAGEAGRAKGELIPEVGKTFHAGLMHSMGSQSRG